jgi:hypothetical protein
MTSADRRDQDASQNEPGAAGPPAMIFEVLTAEGTEGEWLAAEQARAIRGVIEWLARRRSSDGQAPAA